MKKDKMKLHKLTILGYGLGITTIICSIIRWFFLWYDLSQVIIGSSIGIIVCFFAYIYNWMKDKDIALLKQEKRIDDMLKWFSKEEME